MNKPDKSYGDIRHEAKLAHMEKYIDPTEYGQKLIIEELNQKSQLRRLIIEFFSDDLQMDETPIGAMKRNQIRKELLEFAHD